jgi:hypothetical protein
VHIIGHPTQYLNAKSQELDKAHNLSSNQYKPRYDGFGEVE